MHFLNKTTNPFKIRIVTKDKNDVVDFLSVIQEDKSANISLISVYAAILKLWYDSGKENPVQVTRRKIMRLAHIGSIVTYHKRIKDLEELGYIHYYPSYHPKLGSKVFLFKRE